MSWLIDSLIVAEFHYQSSRQSLLALLLTRWLSQMLDGPPLLHGGDRNRTRLAMFIIFEYLQPCNLDKFFLSQAQKELKNNGIKMK